MLQKVSDTIVLLSLIARTSINPHSNSSRQCYTVFSCNSHTIVQDSDSGRREIHQCLFIVDSSRSRPQSSSILNEINIYMSKIK